jgi:hypothetical protein
MEVQLKKKKGVERTAKVLIFFPPASAFFFFLSPAHRCLLVKCNLLQTQKQTQKQQHVLVISSTFSGEKKKKKTGTFEKSCCFLFQYSPFHYAIHPPFQPNHVSAECRGNERQV